MTDALYNELLVSADTDVAEDDLSVEQAVDRALSQHELDPKRRARLRTDLIADLSDDSYPCPADLGTLVCAFEAGHSGDHQPIKRFVDDATERLAGLVVMLLDEEDRKGSS